MSEDRKKCLTMFKNINFQHELNKFELEDGLAISVRFLGDFKS